MNETQFYISVAVVPVTTIIIVMIGVLLNNANMNVRFGDMVGRFADINTRFTDLKDLIQAYSDRQDANLRRVEDELLGKFAELDNRLSRIEHHLNLG
ncbi:MAG TPA: hypothetical protein VIX89_02330 [Bryobacteraceae bacterium]